MYSCGSPVLLPALLAFPCLHPQHQLHGALHQVAPAGCHCRHPAGKEDMLNKNVVIRSLKPPGAFPSSWWHENLFTQHQKQGSLDLEVVKLLEECCFVKLQGLLLLLHAFRRTSWLLVDLKCTTKATDDGCGGGRCSSGRTLTDATVCHLFGHGFEVHSKLICFFPFILH